MFVDRPKEKKWTNKAQSRIDNKQIAPGNNLAPRTAFRQVN